VAQARRVPVEDVIERTARIIRTRLRLSEDEALTRDSSMLDLGADSLDGVEILLALEAEFDCTIPDSAAAHMLTLGDVVDYLNTPSMAPEAATPLPLERTSV
jgi:acyl carrier protein